MKRPQTVVAIPVKNEEERLSLCLAALSRQPVLADHIVLLLNNCIDESAMAARCAPPCARNLHIVECSLLPAVAGTGVARSLAMDYAASLIVKGVLLTTDADAIVGDEWIEANLRAISSGADAVCGMAVIDPMDAAAIPVHLHEDDAREVAFGYLLDEIRSIIVPDPADTWPRHAEDSGASIAITASMYRKIGGLPNVLSGEDRALIERLRSFGARVRHDPSIAVVVSGRLEGRAQGGMAETIRRRIIQQDEFIDERNEPTFFALRRLRLRRRFEGLRAKSTKQERTRLARILSVSESVLSIALDDPIAHAGWTLIESCSSTLRRHRVAFTRLPQEIAAASRLRYYIAGDGQRAEHAVRTSQPPETLMCNAVNMSHPLDSSRSTLFREIRALTSQLREEAQACDADASFPSKGMASLIDAGLPMATIPSDRHGVGLCGPEGASAQFRLLHLLGDAHLALGRLFEAHVNAIELIRRYGSSAQLQRAAEVAEGGKLFALWVTDSPNRPLKMSDEMVLGGEKWFCSGAGFANWALVTAEGSEGAQMLFVSLENGVRVTDLGIKLAGMRAAKTGSVDFTGVKADRSALIGNPGDYLREPLFSTGAWRSSAVALGGLASLIELMRTELIARDRGDQPYQHMRFGQCAIAHETGRLWMEQASLRSESTEAGEEAVAYVNLARTAVESSCLDAIRLVQRSLGLSAFMQGGYVERIARDLATYLRQPAPDETLAEAASFYLRRGLDTWHK